MQPHSLKLSPESDLIISIKEYSLSNNLYGYVSGVVGNLRTVCIQCPGNQEINKFEGNLEIVSLNGNFSKNFKWFLMLDSKIYLNQNPKDYKLNFSL